MNSFFSPFRFEVLLSLIMYTHCLVVFVALPLVLLGSVDKSIDFDPVYNLVRCKYNSSTV